MLIDHTHVRLSLLHGTGAVVVVGTDAMTRILIKETSFPRLCPHAPLLH